MKNLCLLCILWLFMLPLWGMAQPSLASVDTEKYDTRASSDNVFEILMTGNQEKRQQLIKRVEASPNDFIPPVLFALAQERFISGDKEKALFWFYLAQLRTRYEVQLSVDKLQPSGQKIVRLYTREFGEAINRYAFQHPKLLQTIMKVAVNFMRFNDVNYPHSWLYLDGINNYDPRKVKVLMLPPSRWKDVKIRFLHEFRENFKASVLRKPS